MDMAQEFLDQIKENSYWDAGENIVLGVSGGVDSMVLFELLNRLPEDCRPSIHVAHVNHQLREGSDEEEMFVRKWMETNHIPVHTYTWDQDDHPIAGTEVEGRKVRYRFFNEIANKVASRFILTAHHRDDQVETVLMRFVRGSSLNELTGIATKRASGEHVVLRLLLPYSKEMIVNYARENDITWREDESNLSDRYTRNRFRHQIIPELRRENPSLEQHIYDFSKDMEDLLDAVEPLVDEELERSFEFASERIQIDLSSFQTRDKGVQKIVLRTAFKTWRKEEAYAVSRSHIEQLIDWFQSGGPNTHLELPNQLIALKEYDTCIIEETNSMSKRNNSNNESRKLKVNQWVKLNETERIGLFTHEKFKQMNKLDGQFLYLGEKGMEWPLTVRHRWNGDRMNVKGLNGSKKIKDIFIDQKVPRKKRDEAWLITDRQGEIIWLAGYKESPLSLNPLTDTIIYVLVYQHTATRKDDILKKERLK